MEFICKILGHKYLAPVGYYKKDVDGRTRFYHGKEKLNYCFRCGNDKPKNEKG